MPTATSHKNGLPCWADLASTDPAAARAFYAAVLGWTFDEPSPEFGHYSNARKDGAAVAGVWGDLLMVGLVADDFAAAVQQPGVRQHATKRVQIDGHVVLSAEQYERDTDLEAWLDRAWRYHEHAHP